MSMLSERNWTEYTQAYFHGILQLLATWNLFSWRHHEMETFSALLALCAGNSPVSAEFPTQRPVARSFDVFFDLRLNKRLSKQSWGWWFETLSIQLWRHSNVLTESNQTSTEFMVRISDYIHTTAHNAITHPCRNFNGGLPGWRYNTDESWNSTENRAISYPRAYLFKLYQ